MVKTKYIYNLLEHYNIYKGEFPFLDKKTFRALNWFGKLGALARGEEISLPKEGINIKPNWIRQVYYQSRKVPMPIWRPKNALRIG